MSVQQVGGGDIGGKLAVQWLELDPTTTARISIQIAKDPLFTQDYHHFIVPNVEGMRGVSLAVSAGPWFFRVGAWKLTNQEVSWSGVYGPVAITTDRQMKSSEKGILKLLHSQAIDGGLRVFTGVNSDYSLLVEFTNEPSFNTNKMKYRWIRDKNSQGQFEIMGMEPGQIYNIRFAQIEDSKTKIVEPYEWIVLKGKRSMPVRRVFNNEDRASYVAEKVLLEEARQHEARKIPIAPRFSSGTDYARWLAANEKAKAGIKRE
jgi:hypothetical protein